MLGDRSFEDGIRFVPFYRLEVLPALMKAKHALQVSARYFWLEVIRFALTLAPPSISEGI